MTALRRATLLLGVAALGCRGDSATGPTPTSVGIRPAELVDPQGYGDGPPLPVLRDLYRVAERVRAEQGKAAKQPRRSVLCLSGGGSYGAYQAGVLVGWTESGERPAFDTVTGVSTGALCAALAFLGPDYDPELRRVYTTLSTKDVYTRRRTPFALVSDSLADNAPLAKQIGRVLTPATLARLADEHKKGRRLYVGTTDMEGRRPVVWDVGAIAAGGTPESRELVAKVLLASAAIPAFFPPVEIPVTVDGRKLTEKHIDGGVTQGVFYMPPLVPPEYRKLPPADFLGGSDMYVIVAGKLFADPEQVKPRVLKIASGSVSTLIYAETRAELVKLYAMAMIGGVHYRVAAIPQDFKAPASSTDFDPAEMAKMFEEGRRQALNQTAWRRTPPGVDDGEVLTQRVGTKLTRTAAGPKTPERQAGDDPPDAPPK